MIKWKTVFIAWARTWEMWRIISNKLTTQSSCLSTYSYIWGRWLVVDLTHTCRLNIKILFRDEAEPEGESFSLKLDRFWTNLINYPFVSQIWFELVLYHTRFLICVRLYKLLGKQPNNVRGWFIRLMKRVGSQFFLKLGTKEM